MNNWARIILREILKFIGHIYPFYSGGGQLSKFAIFKKVAPQESCMTSLKNGRKIYLNPTEYFGRTVYYFGDYDRKITYFCRQLLDEEDIFLDIGANIGSVFLNCEDILHDFGKIHAFEPNPELVKYLKNSILENKIDNVVIHEYGLSDKDETVHLNIDVNNISSASISRKVGDRQVQIQIKDSLPILETIINNNNIQYLIKIDVEGHESIIFKRLKSLLVNRKPKAVIFEFNELIVDNNKIPEIFNIFTSIGMEIFSIKRGSLLTPELETVSIPLENNRSTDFIAISKERIDWLHTRVKVNHN